MRYTLLDLTQNILSSMDSDEINSINDTVESRQVVAVIKTVYDDLVSRSNLPIQKTPFTLTASGDLTKPVLMTKPLTIDNIEWIRYNVVKLGGTIPVWTDINYISLDQFLIVTQNFNTSDTVNVGTMTVTYNGFTFTFYFQKKTKPCYYTTFDDNTIVFDGYDSAVDSTLQSNKTMCFGEMTNSFTEVDNWVPNLNPQQFPLLLNEAKSLAWAELKQTTHAKAEQTARRNWRHLSKTQAHTYDQRFRQRNHTFDALPNFGRKGARY